MKTKLLDFGIAKVMTETGTAALRAATQRALAALTGQYAAPEQSNRTRYGATGPWTDVYALALVCVESRPALIGETAMELMAATIDEQDRPTPLSRGSAVSAAIEATFQRALAIDPKILLRETHGFGFASLSEVRRQDASVRDRPRAFGREEDSLSSAREPSRCRERARDPTGQESFIFDAA